MYGINKVSGDMLCDFYYRKFGVDTRGLRFPGIISYKTPPSGGTTDYAVEIYRDSVTKGRYTCYIAAGTYLDIMYMPDAIKAVITLLEADSSRLIHRNAFNVTAMSVDPETIAADIRKHLSDFELDYAVDPVRQAIAESWPKSMEVSAAREEWGFQPDYDLGKMTLDMLEHLGGTEDLPEQQPV
jgi:nucleoside-diphosphate-sugar epimerase